MTQPKVLQDLIRTMVDLRTRRDDLDDAQIAKKLNADAKLQSMAPTGSWDERSVRGWCRVYRAHRRPGPR